MTSLKEYSHPVGKELTNIKLCEKKEHIRLSTWMERKFLITYVIYENTINKMIDDSHQRLETKNVLHKPIVAEVE